jgi:hypothetical protein
MMEQPIEQRGDSRSVAEQLPPIVEQASQRGRTNSEYATLPGVPIRRCTVGFKSPTGISHYVDVEAETLYEAAGLGLARLKEDGWIEGLGPGTRLEIRVRAPASEHVISVQQVQRWANGTTSSPAETLRRAKVKKILGV